jgi:hypothetical protein
MPNDNISRMRDRLDALGDDMPRERTIYPTRAELDRAPATLDGRAPASSDRDGIATSSEAEIYPRDVLATPDLTSVRGRRELLGFDDDPSLGPTSRELARSTENVYRYKDPNAPGAGEGEFSGGMADEYRGIPGVVQPGADGMDRVDAGRLAMSTAPVVGKHEREIARLNERLNALIGHDEDDPREFPDDILKRANPGAYR